MAVQRRNPPSKALQLTAYSVRSCVAPAFGNAELGHWADAECGNRPD